MCEGDLEVCPTAIAKREACFPSPQISRLDSQVAGNDMRQLNPLAKWCQVELVTRESCQKE